MRWLLALMCLASFNAYGQTGPLSNPRDLLATDARAFVELLETSRPAALSAGDKARILTSLPEVGEITNLTAQSITKLAAVSAVLRATDRESIYVIRVVDVRGAVIGVYERMVLLISEAALILVSADELQALVVHEIAHEYVGLEYARALALGNRDRIKALELVCDGIAIVTLQGIGLDPSRLIAGLQKMSRFNLKRWGKAANESSYPTLAERRAYAKEVEATLR